MNKSSLCVHFQGFLFSSALHFECTLHTVFTINSCLYIVQSNQNFVLYKRALTLVYAEHSAVEPPVPTPIDAVSTVYDVIEVYM